MLWMQFMNVDLLISLKVGYFYVSVTVRLFGFIACRLLQATNVAVADSEYGSCGGAALQLSPTPSEIFVTKTAADQELHDNNAGVDEFSAFFSCHIA
jgi:hypothetical protein